MKNTAPSPYRFYSPWYWPLWLVIGLLWLLVQLPYHFQIKLGTVLGRLIMLFPSKFKQIARVNISLCFPELTKEQQKSLLKKNFISLGISIFETGLSWFGSDQKLRPLLHLEGDLPWNQIRSEHQGVLLLGAHFLTLELAGRLISLLGYDFAVVYRSHKKPFIDYLISKLLKKHYPEAIERNNVRGIIKALKQGKIVWITPDIDGGYYDHCFIPFFGIPAATITAPVRLAELTGALTMPCAYYRREDHTGYDLVGLPPFDHYPSQNLEQDLSRINSTLETLIRQKPEQYLWSYKRFKTRPSGEKRFY